ncbi:MAG TPA: site-specific integrase [Phycisphaerales bacterium]|nr:site-specific integrase [Phycisphaerales bacterium]HMP37093.1 site-specific integrase [Phycisphaerales bacterium]
MPRRDVPSYRLHKPTGQAVVTIDGRDRYLGAHGSPESHQRYAQALADRAAGLKPAEPRRRERPGLLTCDGLIIAWADHAAKLYANGREAANYRAVLVLLRELNGTTPAAEFSPRDLRRIRDRMVADGRARSAINREVVRLRTIFRWAAAEGLIPASVPMALGMIRGLRAGEGGAREAEPVRPVRREIVEATLAHMPPPVAAMVRLQLLTGMRPGEVCALRPVDLDASGRIWWYTPPKHKTAHRGAVRRIPLIPAAQEILKPFLCRTLDACCFSPAEAVAWHAERRASSRTTPMSCGNRPGSNRVALPKRPPGDRYTTATYGHAITYACERALAEGERWTPNQIRHLVATEVRRHHGIEAARVVCGHSVMSTTETYYAEVHAAQAADVLERMALRQA